WGTPRTASRRRRHQPAPSGGAVMTSVVTDCMRTPGGPLPAVVGREKGTPHSAGGTGGAFERPSLGAGPPGNGPRAAAAAPAGRDGIRTAQPRGEDGGEEGGDPHRDFLAREGGVHSKRGRVAAQGEQ